MNGLIDVLQALWAHLDKEHVDLAAHLVESVVRNADAARLSQHLQAGSDVDPVTEYVVAVDNDVAEVDADAEGDALVLRHLRALGCNVRLYFDGTTYCIDHTRKFQQQPVSSGLDDATALLGNSRNDDFATQCFQPCVRPARAAPHQA